MKTNKFFLFFLIPLIINCSSGKVNEGLVVPSNKDSLLIENCRRFDILNSSIRDGKINFLEASKQFKNLVKQIKLQYLDSVEKKFTNLDWVFPVQGYNKTAIGGSNGNGYIPSNYNYFDGNIHTGHPAQDIFVRDNNLDCIDDISKKSITILSISAGIVIALESVWNENSQLRGGKYILIYDPQNDLLFYYAHNSEINVKIGDIVIPGMVIAKVGRSGLNAFKKRSPTHLHLMCLKINGELLPEPINIYKDLIKMKTK
jgi:murein DD-endopeptidase MepM/ murein hydrolase activator NlpD